MFPPTFTPPFSPGSAAESEVAHQAPGSSADWSEEQDRELAARYFRADIGHAYLAGYLLSNVHNLLGRLERGEQDPRLTSRDRARLDRIERVLATEGWTVSDLRAAICGEPVPA